MPGGRAKRMAIGGIGGRAVVRDLGAALGLASPTFRPGMNPEDIRNRNFRRALNRISRPP